MRNNDEPETAARAAPCGGAMSGRRAMRDANAKPAPQPSLPNGRPSGNVDDLPIGVVGLDGEGVVVWANTPCGVLFDRDKGDLPGMTLGALASKIGTDDASARQLDRIAGSVHGGGYRLRVASQDTSERWLAINAVPADPASGAMLVATVEDVSEAQIELRRLSTAREASETRNRAKSRYLAMLSHEIRTPINGILGMTRMLIDTGLIGEQRGYANTIEQSAEALIGLVNDILDLSKIEVGKLDLHESDFDLNHVVDSVVSLLGPRARQKEIGLETIIDQGVVSTLRGDPGRLRQILVNLIGNAIKFTEEGAVAVHIQSTNETPARITLRFDVTDSGIGVDPEVQPHLFTFYQQGDPAIARRFGGTGLGLAICKTLVEMMGGRIGVDSQSGRGSTFWFTIPFIKQSEAREIEPWRSPGIAGLRVLIVDDNPCDAQIMTEQLSQLGVEVTIAATGEEGLRLIIEAAENDGPFDALICDQTLPGMTGEQLGGRLRSRAEFSDLPIAMTTSSGLRGDAARVRDIGFDAYLTKPVSNFVLAECLRKIVDIGRDRQAAKESDEPLVTAHSIRETTETPPRVLLVEDNKVNQMLALAILLRAGYEVDTVVTGREAVRAIENAAYDAVLMDLQMPEMNGLEALATIRALPDTRAGVPIIAVTAHAMAGTREECLEAGMDDYVSKPFLPETLIDVVARAVHRSPLPATVREEVTTEVVSAEDDAPAVGDDAAETPTVGDAMVRIRKAIEENDIDTLQTAARSAVKSGKFLW